MVFLNLPTSRPSRFAFRTWWLQLGIFVVFIVVETGVSWGAVVLPAIISDHMVLQKGDRVPIWGKADPGEMITVTFQGNKQVVQADASGKWKVGLKLTAADNSPHSLQVDGTNRIEIKDVLVGAVWVCSGQSNMAFSLLDAQNAAADIAKAHDEGLREFHITGPASPQPLEEGNGKWVVTDSVHVPKFSAVGYYFGRKLREKLSCPVGLIDVYWGGTPIESWTSYEGISQIPDLKASADQAIAQWQVEFPKQQADFARDFPVWQAKYKRTDNAPGSDTSLISGPDAEWGDVTLPGKLVDQGLPDAGAVWLRKSVTVDNMDTVVPWIVSIGVPNCFYSVYWNGKPIGEVKDLAEVVRTQGDWRSCTVPGNLPLLKTNEIAIRLFNPIEGLGTIGLPNRLNLTVHNNVIPLMGKWKVKIEKALPTLDGPARADLPPMPTKPAKRTQDVASWLYNSLINPITSYGIQGVIWYQGEANTGRAYQYRQAFPLMIRDWRDKWAQGDFPFYFCQLANFSAKAPLPVESDWAELREAQSMALQLPNTGEAVLIDIGEEGTIHPRNKKDAGERLAAIALAKTYGISIPYTGPVYDSMKVEGSSIRLYFKFTTGGLTAKPLAADYIFTTQPPVSKPLVRNSPDSALEGFAICGDDHKWVWANARIEKDTVVVNSPQVPNPVAVRYAWANNPSSNLSNGSGLPASPFRTDDFPCSTQAVKY